MTRPLLTTGSLREVLLLITGVVLLAFGLLSRPRDPATVASGLGLLVGTPAVAAATTGTPPTPPTPPDEGAGGGK